MRRDAASAAARACAACVAALALRRPSRGAADYVERARRHARQRARQRRRPAAPVPIDAVRDARRRRSRSGEFRRFVRGASAVAARPRRRDCSPTPATCSDWRRADALGDAARRAQPVTNVSWFAAAGLSARARARACRPGSSGSTSPPPTRRGAMRATTRPGARASSAGTRSPATRPLPRGRRRRRTSTACATCTAWSGNGSTTSTRCSSTATAAPAERPRQAQVLRRRRDQPAGPRELRRADAHRAAVLAERLRQHRQPGLSLRATRLAKEPTMTTP